MKFKQFIYVISNNVLCCCNFSPSFTCRSAILQFIFFEELPVVFFVLESDTFTPLLFD